MTKGALILLILAAAKACLGLKNTGALIQLNTPGLNYAKNIGLQFLNKKMQNFHIPDITGDSVQMDGSQSPELLGSFVSYKLTNMYIRKFNVPLPGAHIYLHPTDNINFQVTNIYAYVTGDYWVKMDFKLFSITHSGHITARASGASINLALALTQAGGKPQVAPLSCSIDLGSLDISFGSGLVDKILNLLVGLFKGSLSSALSHEVQSIISGLANAELRQLPTSVEIQDGFNIDYSLTGNPWTTSDSFVVPMLARVWFRGHHDDTDIPRPAPISPIQGHQRMLCAKLEVASVLGSFGYAAQVAGIMHYTFDEAVLKEYKLKPEILDCKCQYLTCIGKMMPELVKPCNGGTIAIKMTSSAAPKAYANSTGAYLELFGDLEFQALHPGKTPEPLFTAHIAVSAIIPSNLQFEGWKIKGEVHIQKATLSIKSSRIGPVDQRGLEFLWETAVMIVVEGELDKVVKNGVELPAIPHVKILNPELAFGPAVVQVCTDAEYTGPILHQNQ